MVHFKCLLTRHLTSLDNITRLLYYLLGDEAIVKMYVLNNHPVTYAVSMVRQFFYSHSSYHLKNT
jgi:hypothetical protein